MAGSGTNLEAYCGNSPVQNVDPSGLCYTGLGVGTGRSGPSSYSAGDGFDLSAILADQLLTGSIPGPSDFVPAPAGVGPPDERINQLVLGAGSPYGQAPPVGPSSIIWPQVTQPAPSVALRLGHEGGAALRSGAWEASGTVDDLASGIGSGIIDASGAAERALGGGVRNTFALTDAQISDLRTAAGQLGFGPSDIRFYNGPSIYSELDNRIWIGPNILPAPATEQIGGTVFETLTARAAIAHEGGHLLTTQAGTGLEAGSLLDEIQASLIGRQLPGLSNVERYQLLRGAAEDAQGAGYSLRDLLHQLPGLGD
jgi:hypothetical protein